MTSADVVDTAAGLAPTARVAILRRRREAFVRHTQGSHDVLIAPPDPAGVTLLERAAAALRVAAIEGDVALCTHYRSRLRDAGADAMTIDAAEHGPATQDVWPRLAGILRHVTMIASMPSLANRAHLDALRDAGLIPRDIVIITQIVAFVSCQVRIVAGLRLLDREAGA